MCYPFAPVTFQGMAAFWSLLSSMTILNLWSPLLEPKYSLSPTIQAFAIMLFSSLQFGSTFLNLFCIISSASSATIARFRCFKHLWIALVDAAFDVMVAGAILNEVNAIADDDPNDWISVTMLIHVGTVCGLILQILEFLIYVMMLGVDEGYSKTGAYCTFCATNTQIFGSNFQCAILLYLLSQISIDDDVVFMGIAITVLVILELILLALCSLTVWHQLAGCLVFDLDPDEEEYDGRSHSINTSIPFGGNKLGIRI